MRRLWVFGQLALPHSSVANEVFLKGGGFQKKNAVMVRKMSTAKEDEKYD